MFKDDAKKSFGKLDARVRQRILHYLEDTVAHAPHPRLMAQRLTGLFRDFWRYRVGDYRVVCSLHEETITILVVHVGHRSSVYKDFRRDLS